MGLGIPTKFLKLFFCFSLLAGAGLQEGGAQSAGDIAFTGFNSDSHDGFAVVTFMDIAGGQEMHFSSKEWDGSSFTGAGGDFTWIAPEGGISAGTVLVFGDVHDIPTVSSGVITDDANMDLSGFGDVIYAFTGSSKSEAETFLGAIGTSTEVYNGIEGTLSETGLVQDSTAILLSDNIDVAEFLGPRSGNSHGGYLNELNDIDSNWYEENGNGDQTDQILPFNNTDFILVDPPIVAFTASSIDSSEEHNTANLTVELIESTGTAVEVEVAYLSGSGTTTNGDDFANYATHPISFSDNDVNGTKKTVTIDLTDDYEFEGTERAVFQLQNISAGTIIEPEVLTLTIKDNDAPDIVFNEINADPGDDANGDGIIDAHEDEFIEFINNEDGNIDIGGWHLFESTYNSSRYTFPEGTVIPAGEAFVVFDDTATTTNGKNFGGAQLFFAGSLSLNNTSEILTLENAEGEVVSTATYPNEASGESNVLDPEITGDSYVNHSSVSGGALSSPGTKADGTAFGSEYAVGIRGSEGWRMVSTPVQHTTYNDLLGNLWMQGVSGSDDPNGDLTLAGWSEQNTTFTAPANMDDPMTPAKGYIVYVFEDDEYSTPGIQGGFPKVLKTNGSENNSTVTITVSANDSDNSSAIDGNEGWNLLGNPFGTDILVSELIAALEDVDPDVNANVYVWDHNANGGNGKYITLVEGDRIAPFQAFFVRFANNIGEQSVRFDRNILEANIGTEYYKENNSDFFSFDLELHGQQFYDTYTLQFDERGDMVLDRYDAYKLFSLNSHSINLFSTHGNNRLQKNVLPRDLESSLEIPLGFQSNGRSSMTFRWNVPNDFPRRWDITLIDTKENREINLQTAQEYPFSVSIGSEKGSLEKESLLNKSSVEEDSRFLLAVNPNVEEMDSGEIPKSVKLNPNYPNPFNPTTIIPFELAEDSEVKLTIWNMIGQKVATLVDGMVEAGTHKKTWNAASMPSGIYIARFEVSGEVFTRKMTLIK